MLDIHVTPVILAGGSGTRLWPVSRAGYPKQLLRLTGSGTLLQETAGRLDGLAATGVDLTPSVVVCNEEHRFLVLEQLEEAGRPAEQIILEPVGRNTAPALTLAAMSAIEGDTDPVLVVMPADHVISQVEAFQDALGKAVSAAASGAIVTFGILATRPETGFGYIRKGGLAGEQPDVYALDAFVEKPDSATAVSYVDSGSYLWNSGIFVVKASVWMKALSRFRTDIYEACRDAMGAGGRDGVFLRVDAEKFGNCPSESIDYAVMEPLARDEGDGGGAAVVPLDAGWSDVGSWQALLDLATRDASGNVVSGDVFTDGVRDSLLFSEHRFLAGVGLEGLIVVETADAILVADKRRSQDVKHVVSWLAENGREEGSSHRRVYRPWGHYESVDAGDRFQVKRLTVKPGAVLSLQMHHHRAEHWVVVRGTARVTRGDEEFLLGENESTYIPLGTRHRLANPGKVPLEVIEVQSGSYLGEDDIVRFEDQYDRETPGKP